MLKKSLPLLALALTGCSGPDDQQLRADFLTMHPGCELESFDPGEGDHDNVYIQFTYTCRPAKIILRSEVLYQRHDGQWHLNRKVWDHSAGGALGPAR